MRYQGCSQVYNSIYTPGLFTKICHYLYAFAYSPQWAYWFKCQNHKLKYFICVNSEIEWHVVMKLTLFHTLKSLNKQRRIQFRFRNFLVSGAFKGITQIYTAPFCGSDKCYLPRGYFMYKIIMRPPLWGFTVWNKIPFFPRQWKC